MRAKLEVLRSPRVSIDPRAVAERDGDLVTLYTSPESTGITTLAPFRDSHTPTCVVETVRLDTALNAVSDVTVVKVDTEGYDLPVLRTFPWDRLHPAAVMCEFEDLKTIKLGYSYSDLWDLIESHDYVVFLSEWWPIHRYGGLHRWRSIGRDRELADARGWGNVIGVDPSLVDRFDSEIARAVTQRRLRLVPLRRWVRRGVRNFLVRGV